MNNYYQWDYYVLIKLHKSFFISESTVCKKVYRDKYKKNYKIAECVTCVNFNAIDYTSGSSESKLKILL
jgi:hypothetical protein